MKTKMFLLAAAAATLTLANSVNAQNAVGYRATGDDGITASPRLRQFLNEHKTVASTPAATVVSVGYRATGDDGITASPKQRQFLNERRATTSSTSGAVASVGYRPTGDDGITASPKQRQFLDEHKGAASFQVAPVK